MYQQHRLFYKIMSREQQVINTDGFISYNARDVIVDEGIRKRLRLEDERRDRLDTSILTKNPVHPDAPYLDVRHIINNLIQIIPADTLQLVVYATKYNFFISAIHHLLEQAQQVNIQTLEGIYLEVTSSASRINSSGCRGFVIVATDINRNAHPPDRIYRNKNAVRVPPGGSYLFKVNREPIPGENWNEMIKRIGRNEFHAHFLENYAHLFKNVVVYLGPDDASELETTIKISLVIQSTELVDSSPITNNPQLLP